VTDYEKLGAFYLGRRFDPAAGRAVADEPLLYESRDLTTHAVIVGMTGSGKTGLGVALLEEAAIDGIPVIAIDPKGDLADLLLAFPHLAAEDFEPWVDPAEAARQGRSPAAQAAALAQRWREGLAQWDQGPERIARYAAAAERVVYTPGSTAGRPLAALRSFAAPPRSVASDDDALRERVLATASSLLGLAGIDADPVRSREHILLSILLGRAWREGRDLDLPALIREVQRPPVQQVGVLDLESFFPAAERTRFALALNNLAASPAFSAWTRGEPLDPARLLYTDKGRPRLSVVSIAHLGDAERMFAVTLLLSELVTWMRGQPGSATLRAVVYMDEVFGFFPPVASPPSKGPMLTLLKQARAFGIGVVLSTQNPVDLDYKGLGNAGTWFLGRLQTERDKARVLEGLESASAAAGARLGRERADALLSDLPQRVFLMSNAHEDEPVLFQTRWTLSYLAGPLTRDQIRRLAAVEPEGAPAATAPVGASAPPDPGARAGAPQRPVGAAGIAEGFLPAPPERGSGPARLRPALLGTASLHYRDARADVDTWEDAAWLAPLDEASITAPWDGGREIGHAAPPLAPEPPDGARFAPLPAAAGRAASFERWRKELAARLVRERPLRLLRCAAPPLVAQPGEGEGAFRGRVRDAMRAGRDAQVEALRRRHAPALAQLQERIARARDRVGTEQDQYAQRKMQAAISIGATLVGALFGRKLASAGTVGRATTAMRGIARAADDRDDVAQAADRVEELQARLDELERAFTADCARLETPIDPAAIPLEELTVAPRRGDLDVRPLVLVWMPEE
jgi:hypothetical protein